MRTAVTVGIGLSFLGLAGCGGGDMPSPPPPPPPGAIGLSDLGTFATPVFLTAPPGDAARVFVVEKRGTIQAVDLQSRQQSLFLDLRGQVSTGSEQGLLGLAFDPDYDATGRFLVNYTNLDGDSRVVLYRVAAGDPNRADPASAQAVLALAQPFPNHNGGMLAFGPDGLLYLGFGDGGSGGDPMGNGQSLGTLLGKVLRLRLSAAGALEIPADNPMVGQAGARGEIWSFGLRNPWRFSFDRVTGDLYLADVGQAAREEVDVVTTAAGRGRGANFGWNRMEGLSCYQAASCDQAGLTLPILDYTHSDGCSVTGGYVYRGSVAGLQGLYFYSDYCGGWVRSFRLQGGAAADQRSWPELEPGGQVTSFGEDAVGELYVMSAGGRVARFAVRP
jgi:glucose/arabinose dehydrogenase